MRKLTTYFFALLISATSYCQEHDKIIGRFSDGMSDLIIKEDSTFELKTVDPVYPYTYKTYQNSGYWTTAGNVVTLNPTKEKRKPILSIAEQTIEGGDSIRIKINYLTEVYEKEVVVEKTAFDFEMLTLYINNKKNYRHVVHKPVIRVCSFSPKVKHQVVIDSSNVVTLPKQQISKFGIYTYGFEKPIELNTTNPAANYFEITVIQPIDKERTPRSRKVIIKKNYAYLYEVNGKIPASGFLLSGLKRMK